MRFFRDLVAPVVISRRTLVLCYHNIERDVVTPSNKFSVTLGSFKAQLAIIHDLGFSFVAIDEIAEMHDKTDNKLRCSICFDDCDLGTIEGASVLARYSGRATYYAIADRIPTYASKLSSHPHLDATALRNLSQAGHEIGSHSVTHRNLSTLADSDVLNEARLSKSILSDVIGRDVTSFCYPFGRYNIATPRLIESAGYRNASALLGPKLDPERPLFEINRSVVQARDTINRFMIKLMHCGQRTNPISLGLDILRSSLRQRS